MTTKSYLVPADTMYRFMDVSKGSRKQFTLNIGSDKNDNTDIRNIADAVDPSGAKEWNPEKVVDVETINDKINSLKSRFPKFPINKVSQNANGTLKFEAKNGVNVVGIDEDYPSVGTTINVKRTLIKDDDGNLVDQFTITTRPSSDSAF